MKILSAERFHIEQETSVDQLEYFKKIDERVLDIITEVRKHGDQALLTYAKKFDQVELDTLVVSDAEFAAARKQVSETFYEAIQLAKAKITTFHR